MSRSCIWHGLHGCDFCRKNQSILFFPALDPPSAEGKEFSDTPDFSLTLDDAGGTGKFSPKGVSVGRICIAKFFQPKKTSVKKRVFPQGAIRFFYLTLSTAIWYFSGYERPGTIDYRMRSADYCYKQGTILGDFRGS